MNENIADIVKGGWTPRPTLGPAPVTRIMLIDRLERPKAGFTDKGFSKPGHTIQCVVSGRVRIFIEGSQYELIPGSSIWFHEDQYFEVEVVEGPWVFYVLNFVAPSLQPPPPDLRVWSVEREVVGRLDDLLARWRDSTMSPSSRVLSIHWRLLELLEHLKPGRAIQFRSDDFSRLWWDVEKRLHLDLAQVVELSLLAEWAGCSVATLSRACRAAVGVTPMKRVKQMKLSYARSLVQHSSLTIGQISERIGYGRVFEFSRDYHKHWGMPPTTDRKSSDRYTIENTKRAM